MEEREPLKVTGKWGPGGKGSRISRAPWTGPPVPPGLLETENWPPR